jgi:hypothetical protein
VVEYFSMCACYQILHVLPIAKKYNFTDALTFCNYKVFAIPPHGWFSLNFRYAWRALLHAQNFCNSYVFPFFQGDLKKNPITFSALRANYHIGLCHLVVNLIGVFNIILMLNAHVNWRPCRSPSAYWTFWYFKNYNILMAKPRWASSSKIARGKKDGNLPWREEWGVASQIM